MAPKDNITALLFLLESTGGQTLSSFQMNVYAFFHKPELVTWFFPESNIILLLYIFLNELLNLKDSIMFNWQKTSRLTICLENITQIVEDSVDWKTFSVFQLRIFFMKLSCVGRFAYLCAKKLTILSVCNIGVAR